MMWNLLYAKNIFQIIVVFLIAVWIAGETLGHPLFVGKKSPSLYFEEVNGGNHKGLRPVVKDGLQVAIRPTECVFALDESLKLSITYKNVGESPFFLYRPNGDFGWRFQVKEIEKGLVWDIIGTRSLGPSDRSITLAPDESYTFTLEVSTHKWIFREKSKSGTTLNYGSALPAGKYRLLTTLHFTETPISGVKDPFLGRSQYHWFGEVDANPIQFEVVR